MDISTYFVADRCLHIYAVMQHINAFKYEGTTQVKDLSFYCTDQLCSLCSRDSILNQVFSFAKNITILVESIAFINFSFAVSPMISFQISIYWTDAHIYIHSDRQPDRQTDRQKDRGTCVSSGINPVTNTLILIYGNLTLIIYCSFTIEAILS